jgi:hypothetical protein
MSNVRRITVQRVGVAALLVSAFVSVHQGVEAQVGHRPEASPYRDLYARRVLALTGGFLSGSSGEAGVGPGDGLFTGARFDLHLGGPAGLTFGAGVANLERVVIDPTFGPDNRTVDTTSQNVLLVDGGFDLLLTGEKTWHRLIPYFGASMGIALGTSVDADTASGYSFSTHFTVGPRLGVWVHPSDRITFRIETRDVIWRLKYPEGFFSIPENEPTEPPVLDANVMKDTQWVHHLGLTLSIGYTIGS